MSKYYPPEYEVEQFNCIHCGVFARQEWHYLFHREAARYFTDQIQYCYCIHCSQKSYWYDKKMIIPAESPIQPPHPDMPNEIINEYNEARTIFNGSPRASAALLRLAVQKLVMVLGEKGKNINDDIKSLVDKGLPVLVQQAFDICRVVGNTAVHPGEIDLNDTPEIAQSLFKMINFIIDDRITKPNEISELYKNLPESAKEAIEKRDSK